MMAMDFSKKVVFITGAASGIGAAQAQAFLTTGAYVFAFDQQKQEMLTLQMNYPEQFAFFIGDVREKIALKKAIRKCHDYLPLHDTDEELWSNILTTNLNSMFTLTKLLLPELLENQGTVINMASIAGLVAGGGGIAYTTSKHAIVGFTKQLALDYAARGLHVNAIAPGAINTPMNQADFAGDGQMAKWVAEETPVKRWADPKEVAYATLFLASDETRYMQGNILPIDGGWLLKQLAIFSK